MTLSAEELAGIASELRKRTLRWFDTNGASGSRSDPVCVKAADFIEDHIRAPYASPVVTDAAIRDAVKAAREKTVEMGLRVRRESVASLITQNEWQVILRTALEAAIPALGKGVETAVEYKYDPLFGDDKICACGHAYYRHFDTYEKMAPVGCKYCGCGQFKAPTPPGQEKR